MGSREARRLGDHNGGDKASLGAAPGPDSQSPRAPGLCFCCFWAEPGVGEDPRSLGMSGHSRERARLVQDPFCLSWGGS